MEIDLFEHFEMIQTGVFFKPQRRKANEGVRISHLDPETRMNSRDEFRQGTNIMMRAMRGVGVWPSTERAGGRRSSSMQSLSPGWRVLVLHSLSVGFASNLCSLSQHVIRARRSKHVVQKNSINHWVKRLSLSKERSGKIKNQGWFALKS